MEQGKGDDKRRDNRVSIESARGRSISGTTDLRTERNIATLNSNTPRKSYLERLRLITKSPGFSWTFIFQMAQPLQILFTIPAVFFVALLWGITMAWMTVILSTISIYMPQEPYNFNPVQIGLMSLSALVGYSIGSIGCGLFADRLVLWLARRNGGIYEPEMRLWVMVPFIPLVPAGAIFYGVALAKRSHWLLLAAGGALINVGVAPLNSISLTYLTDSYTDVSCFPMQRLRNSGVIF
ncbi:hypothetical protein VTK73DRAFT_7514 [Phialemonium thermophilum]|uniref:Uncharacterized protein n=1 Tax=Phialemonium thermophilum TaxID=223376 RepID=A0ABR3WEH6_9PEZI